MIVARRKIFFYCIVLLLSITIQAQQNGNVTTIPVGIGWANNSVNTVIFRKNAVCTFKNTQYISYYDKDGFVVLAKRKLGTSKWESVTTSLKGNTADAHNSISIMVDGDGYLHIAWNHHANTLHYCKSIQPGSLQMTKEMPMTGGLEKSVTYPEFYLLPNGNLLFFYRDGQSGKGNLVINRYDTKTKKWKQLHENLIDGEGQRNAYWQACVDTKGIIHLSWVWRETSNVASNHDICYARSADGGITWTTSTNKKYQLPVTASTAEYICSVPQNSELINQTSMTTDEDGNPLIATYWKDKGDSVPQYHMVFKTGGKWQIQNLGFRTTAFSLNGAGTKRIPISRPQIICWNKGTTKRATIIFRDEERGNRVSIAVNNNISNNKWTIKDLTAYSTGSWEPTFDTELWKLKKQLHLFVQYTEQQDAEGQSDIIPQMVNLLQIKLTDL